MTRIQTLIRAHRILAAATVDNNLTKQQQASLLFRKIESLTFRDAMNVVSELIDLRNGITYRCAGNRRTHPQPKIVFDGGPNARIVKSKCRECVAASH